MREETFCIQFNNQEAFLEFWEKYSHTMHSTDSNIPLRMVACGKGNYIKRADRLLQLLGMVWDAFRIGNIFSSKNDTQNKIQEIADHVIECGDFTDSYFNEIGGKEEMERLAKEAYDQR